MQIQAPPGPHLWHQQLETRAEHLRSEPDLSSSPGDKEAAIWNTTVQFVFQTSLSSQEPPSFGKESSFVQMDLTLLFLYKATIKED
jgi:hypothetical protein